MERSPLIDQLEHNGEIIRTMMSGATPDFIRWRPALGKWSPLEVICHLHDEEREDFRTRLQSVLDSPGKPWAKIDPPAWVVERKYMEQDLEVVLRKFMHERERSTLWLRGLKDPPWSNVYVHPTVGPVGCDLLLSNWVAHDLHHIRQLNNLRYGYLAANSSVPLDYAGQW